MGGYVFGWKPALYSVFLEGNVLQTDLGFFFALRSWGDMEALIQSMLRNRHEITYRNSKLCEGTVTRLTGRREYIRVGLTAAIPAADTCQTSHRTRFRYLKKLFHARSLLRQECLACVRKIPRRINASQDKTLRWTVGMTTIYFARSQARILGGRAKYI